MKTKSIILTVSAFLIAATLCACSQNTNASSVSDSTTTTSGTSTADNSSDESSNESVESSNKSDESSNDSSEEQIDIDSIKAEVLTDKSFWSKFGSITYDGKTISLSDDFDDLKLCTDESIGNEIIDRVNKFYCAFCASSWLRANAYAPTEMALLAPSFEIATPMRFWGS